MKEIFTHFYQFLKTGKINRYENSFNKKATEFGKLFLLFEILFVVAIIIAISVSIIVHPPKNETQKWVKNLTPVWAFLVPVVIAPLVEEFTFRYWLKATKLTLCLSSLFVSYILTNNIINSYYYRIDETFTLEIAISFGVAALMYFALSFKKVLSSVHKFWEKNALILIWISILWFGFSHVKNFPFEGWQYLYAPIMVLPQLAMGSVLAFGRVKYGILFSILIHMIHNSIL